MYPVSQLLLRNLSGIRMDEGMLWINPFADDAWRQLPEPTGKFSAGKLTLFCQDFAVWKQLEHAGAPATFDIFPSRTQCSAAHFVLTLPRSKQRLGMMLDYVASEMPENARLWLAGENRSGIRSCTAQLEKRFKAVEKLDSARHCSLFEAREPLLKLKPFNPGDYREDWRPGEEFGELLISSWPGVFAHGRLDEGTRMLLAELPSLDIAGKVLDFACGSGVISARLAQLHPELRITMTDVDALALAASAATVELNRLKASIMPGNGFKYIDERFDLIVTNPPFHRGGQTDTGLGMQLMNPVRNFLNPRGQLVMVANRHIPYRKWLDRIFGSHNVLAASTQFQVLHAVQSK